MRAAYLHGPYTLYVACYPVTFDPNTKHEDSGQDGVPQFEPNLKAGGSWNARLKVPEKIRATAGKVNARRNADSVPPSVTWIIEVSSQVIFSNTAAVHFEILVGRDEKSIDLGLTCTIGAGHAVPEQLHDHQQGRRTKEGRNAAHPRGVYSKAVHLVVDDTASLWNKPRLPEWEDEGKDRGHNERNSDPGGDLMTLKPIHDSPAQTVVGVSTKTNSERPRKRRKIHLVVLTHGLHSNLGSDMLYLKESIDAAAKQARIDVRNRRARNESEAPMVPPGGELTDHKAPTVTDSDQDKTTSSAPLSGGQEDLSSRETEDDDEEEVIVRGFSGNAVRTERGIQYLGKRLAKYVLAMTYPDQPYLPTKKSVSKTITRAFTGQDPSDVHAGLPSHHHSSIHKEPANTSHLAYQITSISFIGHSLGGLTQTYAIAYIHKHSPHFFEKIKPINFIGLASPFLGLSNENPIYVKFALDFGLVGRTGQDLGLTWRAPTMVRNGWEAMIGGIGTDGKRAHRQPDAATKPLLRVLPTGPAHQVLKMFRNRTVYSNVVNDGIVPLRTSCLLFLDWRGLGRVEKARRENGLVGTMAGWGWAELTGANSTAKKMSHALFNGDASSADEDSADEGINTPTKNGAGDTVPQPSDEATNDEATVQIPGGHAHNANLKPERARPEDEEKITRKSQPNSPAQPASPFTAFLSLLRPGHKQARNHQSPRKTKIYKRSQVNGGGEDGDDGSQDLESNSKTPNSPPPNAVSGGDSSEGNEDTLFTPPKTTVFEAAGDILNPPIPDEEFLMNPRSRPRTIFHDRVYHPEDIPPPPVKRRSSILRTFSSDGKDDRLNTPTETDRSGNINSGGMKLEERIARAYHKDLSWRKVLVRLEPDAHNNMIVRRMFANAYGWPVVKHLVDTHFADTYSAKTADHRETGEERAKPMDEETGEHGEEVRGQLQEHHPRTESERRETDDHVSELKSPTDTILSSSSKRPQYLRNDSGTWDDRYFDSTDNEDDDEDFEAMPGLRHRADSRASYKSLAGPRTPKGTSDAEIADFLHGPRTQEPQDMSTTLHRVPSTSEPRSRSIIVPTSSTSPTTSGLGLGKSIEEHLAAAKMTDSERAEHLAMINERPTFGSTINSTAGTQ